MVAISYTPAPIRLPELTYRRRRLAAVGLLLVVLSLALALVTTLTAGRADAALSSTLRRNDRNPAPSPGFVAAMMYAAFPILILLMLFYMFWQAAFRLRRDRLVLARRERRSRGHQPRRALS